MALWNHCLVVLMLEVNVTLKETKLLKSKTAGMTNESQLGVAVQSATLQPELVPMRELGKQKSVPASHRVQLQGGN